MVVVYSDQSIGASEITPQNWWQVLLRPGVRTGRADPALDPNGYRTLMVLQLAEKFYQQPGLAARLLAAMPASYMRPKEADLTALIQAGELDYSFSYYSLAKSAHLRYVDLPSEVDLSDPARAEWYTQADVWIPKGGGAGADSVEFRGEPIVYALTHSAGGTSPGGRGSLCRIRALARRARDPRALGAGAAGQAPGGRSVHSSCRNRCSARPLRGRAGRRPPAFPRLGRSTNLPPPEQPRN